MLGQKIRDLRKQKRLSQTELGKYIGVSQTTVTAWENGRAEPSSGYLSKLADYFNVTTDYLLGRPEKHEDDQEELDLEQALDNAHSFSGKPLSEHDRKVAKNVLRGLFEN
ncbi:helix-turn-helix domain-containing protein [Limosilactobacillus ingluviei]|uniref:helix-turn-helix domain-containing protein n=1 Tax=Limosilactobacillus ingluviei TaxID=148604 RepID=UPI0024B9CF7A|nr:helix-turn-helix transcriptional regulator [Limosilactobacillus ingluviei]